MSYKIEVLKLPYSSSSSSACSGAVSAGSPRRTEPSRGDLPERLGQFQLYFLFASQ